METEGINIFIEQIKLYASQYGVDILAAIAIFYFGRIVAKVIRGLIRKLMERTQVDRTLIPFVCNLSFVTMNIFIIVAVLGRLGIETTSIIAVLGAAGLAVGLALQGSLSNFAAGVLLIIFKPFGVGDFIEGGGISGTVQSIGIFTTTVNSPDNRKIIVPNTKLSSDNIINFSANDTRRVDLVVGVGYEDNLDKVKRVLTEILESDERVLKDPQYKIAVLELGESSINFVVRPWVNTADYWDVFFDLQETIRVRFAQEDISIPFPQRDVHLFQEKAAA